MTQENQTPIDPRGELRLKLTEPDVSAEEPWGDDVLERAQIAAKLTNLIRDQSTPFAISIHGYWGTGKTFMLKRWQKDLEIQGFQAIYFNAWEDDFCDDPLLAIIGQLSEYFKQGGFRTNARRVAKSAIPLLKENIPGIATMVSGIPIKTGQSQQSVRDPLKEYSYQRVTKDKLKNQLASLSQKVAIETGHPLVFIIDELDRCRPTFAIELLERVKHIFDIPNMVFVFGVNRDELCSSLQSIYGAIDADVYLRRFFDMEFTLPEVDSEKFGRNLMQTFGLGEFFGELSKNANNRVHSEEFGVLVNYFPAVWGVLDLSLRDIDYCVRLIALAGRNLESRHFMHPWLLGLLLPLKLKNLALYRQLTQGKCRAAKVIDHIDELSPPQARDENSLRVLDMVEALLYGSELRYGDFRSTSPSALSQLRLLKSGNDLTHAEYLSKRTQKESSDRAGRLLEIIESGANGMPSGGGIGYLAELIDLYQGTVRR